MRKASCKAAVAVWCFGATMTYSIIDFRRSWKLCLTDGLICLIWLINCSMSVLRFAATALLDVVAVAVLDEG